MYLLTISTKLILKYKKISENKNPQVYGIEHIIYIIYSLIVAFLVRFFTNRLSLVFEYDDVNWLDILPDSICSNSSYVLSLCLLIGKKNNKVLHFIQTLLDNIRHFYIHQQFLA